jgi:hypothetical protein
MEAIIGFFSFVMAIILLIAIIKFFGMCSDIERIKKSLDNFVKYYGEVQAWKHNESNVKQSL